MKRKSAMVLAVLTATLFTGLAQAQPPPPPPGGPPPPPPGELMPPPDPGGPPPFAPGPDTGGPGAAAGESRRGTVKAFNVGPEGEANGLILHDGTVVMFPPRLAAAITSAVKEGSRIRFAGAGRPGVSCRMMVNAQWIAAGGRMFAMSADAGDQPGGAPPPPPGGRERRGPPPPPPASMR